MTIGVSAATRQWCTDRAHPFVTYNPWLDRAYCRCGQRQEPGDQPQDWEAKRQIFHDCKPDGSCRCYTGSEQVAGKGAAPRGDSIECGAQEPLFPEVSADLVAPVRKPRHRPITDLQLPV